MAWQTASSMEWAVSRSRVIMWASSSAALVEWKMAPCSSSFSRSSSALRIRAVAGNGHLAFHMAYGHGLGIFPPVAFRRAIQAMAHSHFARAQAFQYLGLEYIGHKPQILIAADHTVVIHRDAAAFLPAMLQRIKSHNK